MCGCCCYMCLPSSSYRIWRALTTSYGQVMPVVLKQSRLHYLHPPTLDLEEKAVSLYPLLTHWSLTSCPSSFPLVLIFIWSCHKSEIVIVFNSFSSPCSVPVPEAEWCHSGAVRRWRAERAAGHALHHRLLYWRRASIHCRRGEWTD